MSKVFRYTNTARIPADSQRSSSFIWNIENIFFILVSYSLQKYKLFFYFADNWLGRKYINVKIVAIKLKSMRVPDYWDSIWKLCHAQIAKRSKILLLVALLVMSPHLFVLL